MIGRECKTNTMRILLVILVLSVFNSLSSQNSFNSSGSILFYSENNYSCSIGQVFSEHIATKDFLFKQGVQHPVFSLSSSINYADIKNDLNIKIYPNPVNQYIVIELDKPQEYVLKIHNSKGTIIMEKELSSVRERIEMTAFASSIYYLSVISNNKLILTHKFIKYE